MTTAGRGWVWKQYMYYFSSDEELLVSGAERLIQRVMDDSAGEP